MKRGYHAVAALLIALLCVLSGCARLVPEKDTISVYATFYPIYVLADAVFQDIPNAELHCLVQPQDGCLRGYQVSDWDSALLERAADAVILGGQGLENFESALLNWNGGTAVSAVLYNLPLYNADNTGDSERESHLQGPNPHLYMSIDGAKEILESIGATMQSLDPAFANRYTENVRIYSEKLDELYNKTLGIIGDHQNRSVILMNEALIYVAQDYGLQVAAWIDRESGTAFYDQQMSDCLETLAGADAKVILIERQAPQAFVQALEAAGYAVARIDILSTHREGEGFETYLNAQRANAEAIRAAFDQAEENAET